MVSTVESLCRTRTFFEFIYLAAPSILKLALSNPYTYINIKCRALLAQEGALGVCFCPTSVLPSSASPGLWVGHLLFY
jgi:hypothetical protein